MEVHFNCIKFKNNFDTTICYKRTPNVMQEYVHVVTITDTLILFKIVSNNETIYGL